MYAETGLKRSMPCDDLISLKDAGSSNLQAEANRFLDESSRLLLQQSSSKRQRLNVDSVSDKSPATAALEAALMMDDAIGFDSLFDSDLVHISLLSTWTADSVLFSHDDYYPFTKQMYKGAIPSVYTVENVAGILSKLTTAPTVA